MLIKNVVDIDPADEMVLELSKLAGDFGMSDMVEVVMQVAEMGTTSGLQVMFVVNNSTASEVIAAMLACAVVNYGCWIHEEIVIEFLVGGETKPVRFYRQAKPEQYKFAAEKYLNQAKELIEKYYPEPAE